MKTVSVRIAEKQAKALNEIAALMVGGSRDKLVQRAVDLWLEVEGPVYLAALRDAREKLKHKRDRLSSQNSNAA